MNSIKYPNPLIKFREDKEIDAIIKEIKQRPRGGKKKTSSHSKTGAHTSAHSQNKLKNESENFTKSVNDVKKKISPEKRKNPKSPQTVESKNVTVKSRPEVSRRKSEKIRTTKVVNGAPIKSKGVNSSFKSKNSEKDTPKVIQEALNRNKERENTIKSDTKVEKIMANSGKNSEIEVSKSEGGKKKLQKFLTNNDFEPTNQIENTPKQENLERINRRDVLFHMIFIIIGSKRELKFSKEEENAICDQEIMGKEI